MYARTHILIQTHTHTPDRQTDPPPPRDSAEPKARAEQPLTAPLARRMPASVSSGGGSTGASPNYENYGVVSAQYYESGPPASKLQLSTVGVFGPTAGRRPRLVV